MGNASDRTMPKKAYAKCVPNETVSHKKLVKKVTEHLRFFPHGMMEAVLEEVFNRLSEHLAQGDRVTLDGLGTFSVSLKCEGAASEALFSKKKHQGRAHRVCPRVANSKETFADMEYKNDSTKSFNVMELILFIYLKTKAYEKRTGKNVLLYNRPQSLNCIITGAAGGALGKRLMRTVSLIIVHCSANKGGQCLASGGH